MKHTKLMTAAIGFAVAGVIATGALADGHMVKYKVVDGTIPVSLTGKPGDAANGRKIAIHRKKGNCLACHEMPIPEQQFHGKTGPSLHNIALHTTESEFRLRMVDSKQVNEDTMMPSFYKSDLHGVAKKFKGKTMLSAQEIEDVIAYLLTLK